MAEQGGPNEIGAASIGVSANLDALRKDFQTAKAEAGEAGKKAGEAFAQGMGEGQDGFVGPPRPTGKDEAARQWRMTQELAAAEPMAESVPSGAPGGDAKMTAGRLGAAAASIAATASAAERIGELLGNIWFDLPKQLQDLTLAMRQHSELLARSIATRNALDASSVAGNPNVDFTNLIAQRDAAIAQKDEIDQKWNNTSRIGRMWDNAKLAITPGRWGEAYEEGQSRGYGVGSEELSDRKTQRELEQSIFAISNQIAEIKSAQIRTGTILAQEADAAGVARPDTLGRTGEVISPAAAALLREAIHGNTQAIQDMIRALGGPEQRMRLQAEQIGIDISREARTH